MIVIAAVVSAASAFFEARERQDELLVSIGELVRSGQILDTGVLDDEVGDETLVIRTIVPGARRSDTVPLSRLPDGLYTREIAGHSWRLNVRTHPTTGTRFVVAQQTAVRDESAIASALHVFLLATSLLALTLVVVNLVVRRQFQRLDALAVRLDREDDDGATKIDETGVPDEVRPFVTAIGRLRDRDAATLARQRRFIADAAHELRSPIAALSLQMGNLLRKREERVERDRRLELVSRSVERLQRLVAQLLDLARLQDSPMGPTELVDPRQIISGVVADLVPIADSHGIDLGVPETSDVRLRDENGALARLLRNALDNAIRHTPRDGCVDVRVMREGAWAEIRIEDDGPGMSESDLARAFEPFRRGADDTSTEGTGLGLSICREIATRLGGEVRIENRAGGGLRFRYRQEISAELLPDTPRQGRRPRDLS